MAVMLQIPGRPIIMQHNLFWNNFFFLYLRYHNPIRARKYGDYSRFQTPKTSAYFSEMKFTRQNSIRYYLNRTA